MHLPPSLTTIGSSAFGNTVYFSTSLEDVYAYMPDVPAINVNSFANYQTCALYVPNFLYYKYYFDTNWSQFVSVNRCELNPGDYEKLRTQSDITIEDNDDIIPDIEPGNPIDGEVVGGGSITVGSDDPQNFDEMEQEVGDSQSGSLIADGGDGDSNNNMPTNTLKVKIQVRANRWYFFCFPFDVTISECEYPSQYVWREYDGLIRALQGANGWKDVEGTTLTARQGYIFQSATAGTLVVTFHQPTFGGDHPKTLTAYTCDNVANASWNLVGNPYSSYYDFQNTDFDAPITVWNGTSYQAYRPGDDDYHLQPYEAFFVQKPTATNEIGFEKDRRETYNQSRERRDQQANARREAGIKPDRLLINLTIGDDETENLDRTRLVLNEKASLAYDLGCDAAKFINSKAPAQLYMLEGNQKMAINERPAAGDIRLGYMADKAGTLRISAPRMDLPMMLYDATTGLTYDLSLGSYEFQTEAGTFDKRFSLRFSDEATGIRNMMAKTGVAIGLQDGGLSIGGADGKDIDIYGTNGAQMAHQTGNGFVSLPSGVYIVKVNGQSAKIHVK